MTTQAEDLVKALDKHSASVVAASIHIHTGLSQIAEALGYKNPAGRRQDAPGTPRMPGRVHVAADPLRDAQDATQHEWATAKVIWIEGVTTDGRLAIRNTDRDVMFRDDHGDIWSLGELIASKDAKITAIIDGDGNPPHPQACAERVAELQEQLHAVARQRDEALSSNEPEWLDADELGQLPLGSVVIPRSENVPRVNHHGGWFRTPGGIGAISRDIAPARVLWTPEENR